MTSAASLYGAKVSLVDNFHPDEDRLGISGTLDTSGEVEGIAWNYDPTIGVLELGPGLATDPITKYQKALRQVTYYNLNSDPISETREVRFQIIEHFYEVVGGEITWPEARAAAASSIYTGGLQGYLATVMSSDENSFIDGKTKSDEEWIGATDTITERRWVWVTGPESGTHFFQQNPDSVDEGQSGEAVNGHYENWSGSREPNDYGPGEDYAQWGWNDNSAEEDGYIIEYGGMPDDPGSTTGAVSVEVRSVNYRPQATATIPTPQFPSVICHGKKGTLDGSASDDPEDHPLSFGWEQQGGAVIASSGLSVTTFTAPNADTVLTFTLTVTDHPPARPGASLTDTAQVTLTVANQSVADLWVTEGQRVMLGQPTTLSATVAAGCSIEYSWAFGDGLTETGRSVEHFYRAAGVYTAVVTASDPLGGIVTATTHITIVAPSGGYYVPPNAQYSSRDPALLVTAVEDDTLLDIADDDADGDADDTQMGIKLDKGQSYVVYIQDGAINDDFNGPQAMQGDYFLVASNKPVIVSNFTGNATQWEHDFVPATNKSRTGTDFYLYVDAGDPSIDPIAYSDDTKIKLIDVTDVAMTGSGKTSILSDANGEIVMTATLHAGEDLLEVYSDTFDLSLLELERGHTYHLLSNKKVALQYGTPLGHGTNDQRDGGTYVPSKNGELTGKTFYFGIPYYAAEERELRIGTYDNGADVSVRGWDTVNSEWDEIRSVPLETHGHLELVGDELLTNTKGIGYYFFEVLATADIYVFETSWFETGSYGTSDIATYVTAETGSRGRSFEAYLGPPSDEPIIGADSGTTNLTHLYVFANQETEVMAYDSDAYGEWIELYNSTEDTITLDGWKLTNGDGASVNLSGTIPANGYYLMEYHEKATEEEENFAYGDTYPFFKLGNGWDSLTLKDDSGAVRDSFTYSETWGHHGVYYALERIDPTGPANDTSDWADAVTAHGDDHPDNLGAYYGTPGVENDNYNDSGSGEHDVVINEFMAGRIWRHFTITETVPGAGGYHDIALTKTEWEALYNGDGPNHPNSGDPEGPYITVEADKFVSLMNTNWNDNWMAYATPSYPAPSIEYVSSHYRQSPGGAVKFTADIRTDDARLYDPVTTIEIPAGLDYVPGSYISPTQLMDSATVYEQENADGSWTLIWEHGEEMTPTVNYRFIITATVPDDAEDGTWLRSVAGVRGIDDSNRQHSVQDVVNVLVDEEEEAREERLIINEVMVNPVSGEKEWIELYNADDIPIVLTGKVLSATGSATGSAPFSYTIPQVDGADLRLPPDSYVVIHLTYGVSETHENLYTGIGPELDDSEGRIYLFASSEFEADNLIDFVQWDDDGVLSLGTGDDLAVTAGHWPAGSAYVTSTLTGDTLGRDRYSSDTALSEDWENTGGIHSGAPTPGAVNWTHPGIRLEKIADPRATYPGGTVLYTYRVYNTGDEPLLNVTLVDDETGCEYPPYIDGDTDEDDELDPDEVWNYACSTVLDVEEVHVNHATAGGNPSGGVLGRKYDDDTAEVIVTSGAINEPPQPADDVVCTHRLAPRPIDVLTNDDDPEEGNNLTVVGVGTPHTGTAIYDSEIVTYTPPNATFTGTVVFTYTVADSGKGGPPGVLSSTATITVYVTKNERPIARDDFARTTIDASRTLEVLENDSDEDIPCTLDYLTVVTIGRPLTGSAILNEDYSVTYIPPSDYTGTLPFTVTFPYTISDNALGATGPLTDVAWITIVVYYPVGGYTAPLNLPIWPWVMLAPVLGAGLVLRLAISSTRRR